MSEGRGERREREIEGAVLVGGKVGSGGREIWKRVAGSVTVGDAGRRINLKRGARIPAK